MFKAVSQTLGFNKKVKDVADLLRRKGSVWDRAESNRPIFVSLDGCHLLGEGLG